jgi:hypothetical protein
MSDTDTDAFAEPDPVAVAERDPDAACVTDAHTGSVDPVQFCDLHR